MTDVEANSPDRFLRIGESYRYGSQSNTPSHLENVGDLPNWYWVTHSPAHTSELRFQSGIWAPARVNRGGEKQAPLVFCSTSPHKHGSWETPWEDVVAPDEGFAIYFGDNKDPANLNASSVRGNREMLDAMRLQHSPLLRDRLLAPPILLTTSEKGVKRFDGLGVVTKVEVVMQRLPGDSLAFQNLRFEITILALDEESDRVSMKWLNARRASHGGLEAQLEFAPRSWREFVENGISAVPALRRRVYQRELSRPEEQMPVAGSELDLILNKTLDFFEYRKHNFESVAARVVERHFEQQGLDYKTGWITQKSGDGGFDFVGRVNLDPAGAFSSSRQIILGQAKCERSATNGKDLARLAARLGRGWLGAYVTTSYFSRSVQREVAQDKYPLLLVPGVRVAASIRDDLALSQLTLTDYLESLHSRYAVSPSSNQNFAALIGL